MYNQSFIEDFREALYKKPDAVAIINGSPEYTGIRGIVRFYGINNGVLICTQAAGLPKGEGCECQIFAFHIHNGFACSGNSDDYFADADGHFNPNNCPHPCHAGDMPPLIGADGRAFSAFFTDRFTISEIIGKTVIIHSSPDDFTTQPAGNSGKKIACGIIRAGR